MKRTISVLVSLVLLYCLCCTSFAADTETTIVQNVTEYFEDGSYITMVIKEDMSSFSTYATNTKKGTKTITYRNSDNEAQWSIKLSGTFSYTGTTAVCTASSITYTIFNDNWKITSATASKTMNKAVGNVTAKQYALGIPIKTVEQTVTLICSASGVLS